MSQLCLHAGAGHVSLEEISSIALPEATETYVPVGHRTVYDLCVANLAKLGYEIKSEQHGLTKDGARWFGILDLSFAGAPSDYTLVAGLRNSYDKAIPAGLVVGSKVFVCDNLAFSGEVKFSRKHTINIMRDLPVEICNAFGQLIGLRASQSNRINGYKARELAAPEVNDFLIRSMERADGTGVIPPRIIPDILQQWDAPNHPEFKPRNAWSLFNAYTEVLKGTSQVELPKRTIRLHGLMDTLCGLDPLKAVTGATLN